MLKKVRLLKDIIIPAGTILEQRFGTTDYGDGMMYQEVFGLSKDTSGTITYEIEPNDPDMKGWFEDVI